MLNESKRKKFSWPIKYKSILMECINMSILLIKKRISTELLWVRKKFKQTNHSKELQSIISCQSILVYLDWCPMFGSPQYAVGLMIFLLFGF